MYAHERRFFLDSAASTDVSVPLTPRTERHVRGRRCWVWFGGLVLCSFYLVANAMTHYTWCEDGLCMSSWWAVTRMYLCTFTVALSLLVYHWRGIARDEGVPLGLLISIWFTSGTLSVGMCAVCNWCMVQFWAWLDPYCFITYPADGWPWGHTSTQCMMVNLVQWILTAGIIEEGFKFLALLRLRPTPATIKDGASCCGAGCCLFCIPRGWWMRLADTPLTVALCGLAVGGGLATTENFMYIFTQDTREKAFGQDDFLAVYGRLTTSLMHMWWTGYAACGLARWQFLPGSHPDRPHWRACYLWYPIVLHGAFNWCNTLQKCEPYETTHEGQHYETDGCYMPPLARYSFVFMRFCIIWVSYRLWSMEFEDIETSSREAQEAVARAVAAETEARGLLGLPPSESSRADRTRQLVWQAC